MDRFKIYRKRVFESFWFLPALIVVVMIIIAHFVIFTDRTLGPIIKGSPLEGILLREESMRTFLATIAGSMMTVAGVVFSITILVLSQAAGQYTSRVLRNFMKNKNNQFVLGLFVGIFIFCLFLLANLHPTDNLMAALAGFGVAILGVGFLISFIHSMSTSIQSSEIILNIKNETIEILEEIYPKTLQESPFVPTIGLSGVAIPTMSTGYIQKINRETLLSIAIDLGRKIQTKKKNGEFVIDSELLCIIEGEEPVKPEVIRKVNAAFSFGAYRTAENDITFGIQQLVDIALKGLSPGVNDLMTAQLAIDYLSSIFHRLANRRVKHEFQCEGSDCDWLIIESWCFSSLSEMGFIPIIENAHAQPYILKKIETDLRKIRLACKEEVRVETIDRLIQKLQKA